MTLIIKAFMFMLLYSVTASCAEKYPAQDKHPRATSLMLAAGKADRDEVQRLLDRRSDINAQDNDGRTALMYALYPMFDGSALGYSQCAYFETSDGNPGSEVMVCLLLQNKADINVVDKVEYTPLMYAVTSAQPAIVRTLLARGASVDICSEKVRAFLKAGTVFELRPRGLHPLRCYPNKIKAAEEVRVLLRDQLITVALETTHLSPDAAKIVAQYVCG